MRTLFILKVQRDTLPVVISTKAVSMDTEEYFYSSLV